MSKLSNYLPNEGIDIFKILDKKGVNIKLVDPLFYNPDKIDLILNARIYVQSRKGKEIHLRSNLPVLVESKFGWIVMGDYKRDEFTSLLCELCGKWMNRIMLCQSYLLRRNRLKNISVELFAETKKVGR